MLRMGCSPCPPDCVADNHHLSQVTSARLNPRSGGLRRPNALLQRAKRCCHPQHGVGDSNHCTEIVFRGMHKGTHGSDYVGSALRFRDATCNVKHCRGMLTLPGYFKLWPREVLYHSVLTHWSVTSLSLAKAHETHSKMFDWSSG